VGVGTAAIIAAIAETSGAVEDDLVPGMVARTLWWTHRSIFLVGLYGLLAVADRQQLVVRLRVAADRATTGSPPGWGSTARARADATTLAVEPSAVVRPSLLRCLLHVLQVGRGRSVLRAPAGR
jgi:hypothetical protein